MLNLLLDVMISSITIFPTSFLVFDFIKKHSFVYILITSILGAIFTLNIYYFFIIFLSFYIFNYLFNHYKNKNLFYFLGYLLLFNFNINFISFLLFIIILLINNCILSEKLVLFR